MKSEFMQLHKLISHMYSSLSKEKKLINDVVNEIEDKIMAKPFGKISPLFSEIKESFGF